MELDEVYAVYIFMYNYGHWAVTAALMQTYFGKPGKYSGWSLTSTKQKVLAGLHAIADVLKDKWIDNVDGAYTTPFDTKQFFDEEVQLAMDTVPIACYNRAQGLYQPKYSADVMKLFAVTTLRGFIVFIGNNLFTGSTHDGAIQTYTGVDEFLNDRRLKCLADGLFSANNGRVIKTFTGPQIWPVRLHENETIEAYKAAAEDKLRFNTKVAHFRSRVEHVFGATQFGKWNIFKKFRHQLHLAWFCSVAAIVALNIDNAARNGARGRYPDITPHKRRVIEQSIINQFTMSGRYPEVQPEPFAAAPAAIAARLNRARLNRDPNQPDIRAAFAAAAQRGAIVVDEDNATPQDEAGNNANNNAFDAQNDADDNFDEYPNDVDDDDERNNGGNFDGHNERNGDDGDDGGNNGGNNNDDNANDAGDRGNDNVRRFAELFHQPQARRQRRVGAQPGGKRGIGRRAVIQGHQEVAEGTQRRIDDVFGEIAQRIDDDANRQANIEAADLRRLREIGAANIQVAMREVREEAKPKDDDERDDDEEAYEGFL